MAFMFETRFPQRVTAYAAGLDAAAAGLRLLRPRADEALRPEPARAALVTPCPHAGRDPRSAARRSWVASAEGHADFPLQNLPLGWFSPPGGEPRAGVAIGDEILDLAAARPRPARRRGGTRRGGGTGPALNGLLGLGAGPRRALRARLSQLLAHGARRAAARSSRCCTARPTARMHLPAAIGDYTDFYVGIHHATNVGKLFRPDNPLLPNYKWVPIGYHGRAVDDPPVRRAGAPAERAAQAPRRGRAELRPLPQPRLRARAGRLDRPRQRAGHADPDRRGGRARRRLLPAQRLVGARRAGLGVPAARARSCPRTSTPRSRPGSSPPRRWQPFRTAQPPRPADDPAPLPYLLDEADQRHGRLRDRARGAAADRAHARRRPRAAPALPRQHARTCTGRWRRWWRTTPATAAASPPATCSAPAPSRRPTRDGFGSLLEITAGGKEPLALPDGETRTFLEDGDEIILRARARARVRSRSASANAGRVVLPADDGPVADLTRCASTPTFEAVPRIGCGSRST